MKMIVNKPQFDVDKIEVGQAYYLTKKDHRGYYTINTPCLIRHAKPLSISVEYYNDKKKAFDELTIDINSVVDKTFKLEKMAIEGK